MLFKEIRLQTKELASLHDFYKNIFGLPATPFNAAGITISVGQTALIFEPYTASGKPFYHIAFNIPSNKMDEAVRWLKSKVILLWLMEYNSYVADFTTWHAKSVYFFDPSGNILELIARSDRDDMAEGSFSPKQIRSVSEIGLAFPDAVFEEEINKLIHNFKLPYFAKQLPSEHFRAIGDDEGLFICVPEKRNWYPTTIPSGLFPLSIRFEDQGNDYYLQL